VFHAGAVSLRRVRVIDCNICGATVKAANDEDLAGELREHMSSEHSDAEWDAEEASELVADQAYDATDS
jgi:uncharacterized protein DUF1059